MAFATNYLGHFLLTRYLQELISRSAVELSASDNAAAPKFYGRILNVASAYHFQSSGHNLRPTKESPMPIAARSDMQSFLHKITSYGNNKLAQVLHAKELQRRLSDSAHIVALSTCPGWTRTPIIPKNPIGAFVARNAFPAKAAALGPIMALLDPSLRGGEFVTNYIDPITMIPGTRLLMRLLTQIHYYVRALFVDGLAMLLLLAQSSSYGYHIDASSDESMDEELAAALYDWTDQELTAKGY
jgi:NAD(P)-dependent dehydrogenase (short-subunit alcohol dehydrogenase family)